MKSLLKSLLVLVLCAAFLFMDGCNNDQSFGPVASSKNETLQKGGLLGNLLGGLVDPLLLPLGAGKNTVVSATKSCSPGSSSTLTISYTYHVLLLLPVTRTASLTVPAGALNQTTSITMSFDTTDCSVHFQPEGLVFNKPASLNFSVSGLGNIGLGLVGYFYVDNHGVGTPLPYTSLTANLLLGNIMMTGGQVPHFSRYAFAR